MAVWNAGNLAGRHAVVTGASRGIGAAVARRLSGEGVRVSLIGRDRERLARAAEPLAEAEAFEADVTDHRALRAAFAGIKARGPVDILVNNAGAAESEPFLTSGDGLWHRMMAVNLHAVRACILEALPGMLEQRWGRIVTIASTAGLKGYAYTTAYSAAKHAVIGLTRALALETAPKGVTVNAVCPGFADTGMTRAAIQRIRERTGRSAGAALAELTRFNPQGRLVRPDEVAAAVHYLCRPEADAVTGQALAVDGGELA